MFLEQIKGRLKLKGQGQVIKIIQIKNALVLFELLLCILHSEST